MTRKAFTLIEVLVVVAVIGLLVAILVPSLSSAREASRVSVCASNLRQCFIACRMYADVNRGRGPAIGQPHTSLPNWALQVQSYAGTSRSSGTTLYRADSVLVCPTIQVFYPEEMTRTYAMNATGHARNPADPFAQDDPDSFDVIPPQLSPPAPFEQLHYARINFDRVSRPADAVLLVDSARGFVPPPAPPSTRTVNPIDFRNPDHISKRLGIFHRNNRQFNALSFDGSCRSYTTIKEQWKKPLP